MAKNDYLPIRCPNCHRRKCLYPTLHGYACYLCAHEYRLLKIMCRKHSQAYWEQAKLGYPDPKIGIWQLEIVNNSLQIPSGNPEAKVVFLIFHATYYLVNDKMYIATNYFVSEVLAGVDLRQPNNELEVIWEEIESDPEIAEIIKIATKDW